MNTQFALAVSVLAATLLAGCVNQEQADAKMIKGCEAAVSAMIEPRAIKEIKTTHAANEKTEGSVYRRVEINLIDDGDFIAEEKQYSCLFSQQWGMFKSSHAALLEQLVLDDGTIIGKKDGVIQGSMDDFLKLNSKAETAMAQ